ncbi:hypothetical protein EYB34_11435 [Bordetella trematum]|nr:hypothetical protein EYB34_11435 [Bordetella trematum]
MGAGGGSATGSGGAGSGAGGATGSGAVCTTGAAGGMTGATGRRISHHHNSPSNKASSNSASSHHHQRRRGTTTGTGAGARGSLQCVISKRPSTLCRRAGSGALRRPRTVAACSLNPRASRVCARLSSCP